MPLQIANSVLNATELDEAVAQLMMTARSDGYAQGYLECSKHVTYAHQIKWDNTRSATSGVNTQGAFAAAKANYDTLKIPILELIDSALPHPDFIERLKEIFAGAAEDAEQGIGKTPS